MSLFGKLFGRGDGSDKRPLDLEQFAQRMAQALREALPGADVRIELASEAKNTIVRIRTPGGIESSHFLGNAFTRYRSAPDALNDVLTDFVDTFVESSARLESEEPRAPGILLPVLKSRGWLGTAEQQLRATGDARIEDIFLIEPFAGDIILTYVEDTPSMMSFASTKTLEAHAVARSELHAHALGKLRGFLPQISIHGGNGRFAVRLDRNYDSSMLLLYEDWRDRVAISGAPVFAVPARDELMVCGSQDSESVASLRDIAQQIAAESAYSISAGLLTWRDGKFIPYQG